MIRHRVLLGVLSLTNEQKIRVSVDIYGQTYKMVGTESSSHMRQVASIVDSKMKEISERNPALDTAKIAVLTAVNCVHENIQLHDEIKRLKEELGKMKG